MCGIAGYVGLKPPSDAQIQACVAALKHRGPDGWGFHRGTIGRDRHVVLIHTRLSIIDLDERANQPFHDGGRVIVFNGEIYNYLELRQELERQGEVFHTTSDSEVLIRALGVWGMDALDRLEGMWAFAMLDTASGRVVLSRDRFGEKPLFVRRDAHGLYFASEPKGLAALSGVALRPNLDHVRRYLVNGYRALHKGRPTFFEEVEKIPASHVVELDGDGGERRRAYWSPAFRPVADMAYDEAVAGARDAILESMRLRLRADVPLAFCMSGGVDSNSLIAVAKRVFDYDVHGFTIVNSDARYEEQDMVEASVRELNIRHTAIALDRTRFLERLRRQVAHHDSPVTTISYFLNLQVVQSMAAQGYKISFSGLAADELFSGYFYHHLAYLGAISGDAKLHDIRLAEWRERTLPFIRNPMLRRERLYVDTPGAHDHLYEDVDKFSANLTAPWAEPFQEERFCDDVLRNRMLNEVVAETVPVYLHDEDLNAMSVSIENRSPFLDRRLFEHCFSIPTRHLMGNGMAKMVLRDAMRGIVPDAIVDNPRKVGFNAPVLDLLDVKDPEVRAEVLKDSEIFSVVRRDAVRDMLVDGTLRNADSKFLFGFLAAKMFLEECG